MPSAVATTRHPADLARAFLGHDHWSVARDILAAVFTPHARVAVKSCHASSKTFTSADAIVLALLAGFDVLTTAPTWEQVRTVLWGTVHRALLDARLDLSSWDINQTEIRTGTGAHALGLSTNEGVRFQGWHARPESALVVIFDEAPGVLPSISEAVQGISAGGDVRWLQIGNPVVASGPFFDIFAGDVPGWTRITIDAFDTPNLRGLTLKTLLALPEHELDRNERPYLVTRRWVRDRYYEWGEDHPLWQSRVRGQFPLQGEDALLSLTWLEQAKARPERSAHVRAIVAGIDVAGPGEDEFALTIRAGDDILHQQAWAQADPRGAVLTELRAWAPDGLTHVNVDSAGLGYHWTLDLREALKPAGVTVSGINVGEASDVLDRQGNRRFANLKAELYWAFRERCAAGELTGLKDQRTIAQLAGIRYRHDAHGRVVIESKEDARKRGVKSPDRAESVILAFAPPRDRLAMAWDTAVRQPAPLTPAHQLRRLAINSPEYVEPEAQRRDRSRPARGWR